MASSEKKVGAQPKKARGRVKNEDHGKSSRGDKSRAPANPRENPELARGGKKVQVCIRLKRDQRRTLQQAALDRDMSVQDLIFDALKEFGIDLGSDAVVPDVAPRGSRPGSIDPEFDVADILAVLQEVIKIMAAAARPIT